MQLSRVIIMQLSCKIMKNSKKRNKILDLFKSGHLLTANEVCQRIPDVDRATIYRNLLLLSNEGILREVNVKKGISSYEINVKGDHHQHFICSNCDKVLPIDVDEEILKQAAPKGTKLEDFELNLVGKCQDCN